VISDRVTALDIDVRRMCTMIIKSKRKLTM